MLRRLLSFLTFPGVLVHQAAYQLFSRKTNQQIFIMEIGIFIINTVVGAITALPGVLVVIKFGAGTMFDYILIWLGVSIAAHSFPSLEEARKIWIMVRSKETPCLLKITATPIIVFMYFFAKGSVVWLDLFYGIGVVLLLPGLLFL